MRYMDFEKEYIKDRLIEPYSENEDTSDWANLTRYAEDNLQKAYNFGYDECFHKANDGMTVEEVKEKIRRIIEE